MTTIVKRIALLAVLAVVVVTARAQFGSYSHDLPFMGVDASADAGTPLFPAPAYHWVATNLTDGSVETWADLVQSAVFYSGTNVHPVKNSEGVFLSGKTWFTNATYLNVPTNFVLGYIYRCTNNLKAYQFLHSTWSNPPNSVCDFLIDYVSSGAFYFSYERTGYTPDTFGAKFFMTNTVNVIVSVSNQAPFNARENTMRAYTNGAFSLSRLSSTNLTLDTNLQFRALGYANYGYFDYKFEGYIKEVLIWTNLNDWTPYASNFNYYATNTYGVP